MAASATTVTSPPSRSTFAVPSRSTCSPSGTCPLVAYSPLCSKKITGSGSRTAAASSPFTSGTDIAQFSTLCECWAPKRAPEPFAVRMTSGSVICPADM